MTSSRGKRRKERRRLQPTGAIAPQTAPIRRSRAPVARPRQRLPLVPLVVAGVVFVAALGLLAFSLGWIPGTGPGPGASPTGPAASGPSGLGPPDATPLASPPTAPAGDGTRAIIDVPGGRIVIELYNQSSPVAAQNFINLADAGYYDGVVFHRIVPGFVIQGGDPEGTGSGGPGYGIPDEPVVGEYVRGTVAMARTQQPNSQGSQFFVVLDDSVRNRLDKAGGYAIFGRVVDGMEIVDAIAGGEAGGRDGQTALEPVVMQRVTIERP